MSTTLARTDVSEQTLETVIGTGDLAKLSPKQRVEYYAEVCRTVGLNPLTRPFRFMNFQGQTVLYATRDCADQLRSLRKIDLTLTEKRLEGELFLVTARARTPDGRHDEDVGAIMLGKLQGDARANAIMKCITKAKRRVTLSVCGLGLLDETEVETLPNARTYDHEAAPALESTEPKLTRRAWLDAFVLCLSEAQNEGEVRALIAQPKAEQARATFQNGLKSELEFAINAALAAHAPVVHEPEVDDLWPGDDNPRREAVTA